MLNRYILEGIASDLEGGAHIAVFISPGIPEDYVVREITSYTDEEFTQVSMAWHIIRHASGGYVMVTTDAQQARGRIFDTVVVPHGYLHPSPGVEIIEY